MPDTAGGNPPPPPTPSGIVRRSLFTEAEVEAHKHKWIQSEKAGRDLGDAALMDWHRAYWRTFCRERWLEHLQGQAFWVELDNHDYNLLSRLKPEDKGLWEQVVNQIANGAENLQIIEWARTNGVRMRDVLSILQTLDINGHRLAPTVELVGGEEFAAGIHARHRPRALLAERDASQRELLSDAVAEEGVEVSAAGSGEEALDIAQQRRFDLFLLDVALPDRSGAEVAWYLHRHGVTAPIVALVAPDGVWHEDDLFDCGFSRLLQRPVDEKTLRHLARDTAAAVLGDVTTPSRS